MLSRHYDTFGHRCTPVYGSTGGGGSTVLGEFQCAPATPALGGTITIAVPANAATPVWTTNTATKGLTITYNCPSGVFATSDSSAS